MAWDLEGISVVRIQRSETVVNCMSKNYGPIMAHECFPSATQYAFGSPASRIVNQLPNNRVLSRRNTGSNPAGDQISEFDGDLASPGAPRGTLRLATPLSPP